MSSASSHATMTRRAGPNRREAHADLAVGFGGTSMVAGATWLLNGLPATYLGLVAILYLTMWAIVARAIAGIAVETMPKLGGWVGRGLGSANRVTLARATLVLPVAGALPYPELLTAAAMWTFVAMGIVAMAMDGIDGRVARATGSETAFGARFDMELDAFLMLVLSLMLWVVGKAGLWVLLIGGMRYLFVAAGRLLPRLRGALPPSRRRQAVCVIQGAALVVAISPVASRILAQWIALTGLGLLVYSFAADVWWLWTREPRSTEELLVSIETGD